MITWKTQIECLRRKKLEINNLWKELSIYKNKLYRRLKFEMLLKVKLEIWFLICVLMPLLMVGLMEIVLSRPKRERVKFLRMYDKCREMLLLKLD
jgi:hypothetical protein